MSRRARKKRSEMNGNSLGVVLSPGGLAAAERSEGSPPGEPQRLCACLALLTIGFAVRLLFRRRLCRGLYRHRPAERESVLACLHQERFQDRSPAAVYATLLDE